MRIEWVLILSISSYSWDFGFHWSKFKFSSKPVRVNRLMTETTGTSSKFIITGVRADSSSNSMSISSTTTVIAQIDFSLLIARKCERKEDKSSDFEEWNLGGCFMGEETTYLRRKQDALCKVDLPYNHLEDKTKKCKCDRRDYEW